MSAWFPIAAATGVSVAALIGSGLILLLGRRGERAEIWLLSYAIGTLLGAATLGLLPKAIEHSSVEVAMPLLLGASPRGGWRLPERRRPHMFYYGRSIKDVAWVGAVDDRKETLALHD